MASHRPPFRRIAVFCGSSPGNDPVYAEAARQFGQILVERGLDLVYGGGNVGLMGILADTVMEGGREVLGVITHALVDREVAHRGISRLDEVETMHERKQRMYDLADAVVALPGGIGTLDELFEALTWNQLGYLSEPCGLLNIDGYFDPLVELLDHMVGQGFLSLEARRMLRVEGDANRLLDTLSDLRVPRSEKWIRGGFGQPA